MSTDIKNDLINKLNSDPNRLNRHAYIKALADCSGVDSFIAIASIASRDSCKHNRILALSALMKQKIVPTFICKSLVKQFDDSVSFRFCGSLMVALEDEFKAVRLGALDCLLHFSLTNDKFKAKSLQMLIDCLHDDSGKVRCRAAQHLGFFMDLIDIKQIEMLLDHLYEQYTLVNCSNTAILECLKYFKETNVDWDTCSLMLIVRRLTAHLLGNPSRVYPVTKVLFYLGTQNSFFIKVHLDRFLNVEGLASIHDPRIQCRIIMVIGAMWSETERKNVNIGNWNIPNFVRSHYFYLRYLFDFIPSFYGHINSNSFLIPPKPQRNQTNIAVMTLERIKLYLKQTSEWNIHQSQSLLKNIECAFYENFDFYSLLMDIVSDKYTSQNDCLQMIRSKYCNVPDTWVNALFGPTGEQIGVLNDVIKFSSTFHIKPENIEIFDNVFPLMFCVEGLLNVNPASSSLQIKIIDENEICLHEQKVKVYNGIYWAQRVVITERIDEYVSPKIQLLNGGYMIVEKKINICRI